MTPNDMPQLKVSPEGSGPLLNKVLVFPYAVGVEWKGDTYWQSNIGACLEMVGSCFERTVVCTRIVDQIDGLFLRPSGPLYRKTLKPGIVISRLPKIGSVRCVISALRIISPQITDSSFVYVFLPSAKGLAAAGLSWLRRRPYGVYIGADWLDAAQYMLPGHWPALVTHAITRLVALAERLAVRGARFTLAHGAKIVARHGGAKRRVFDTVPVMNWGPERTLVRQDTCQDECIRCLFVGTLSPRKGIEYLLQALAISRERLPSLELDIIGAGSPESEHDLRRLISSLDLGATVHLLGYVADPDKLVEYYRRSDIFVLPTLAEGFPRVLYEAMLQSLPIVTTSTGSIPAVLTDGETALLVPPRSAEHLASAIEQIVSVQDLRRRLMHNGREVAIRRLSGDGSKQFKNLLRSYIGNELAHERI